MHLNRSGDKTKLFCDESKFPEIMKSNQVIAQLMFPLTPDSPKFSLGISFSMLGGWGARVRVG